MKKADPRGFLDHARALPPKEPAESRIGHSREFEGAYAGDGLEKQAARCMQCGIPYCHQGCPLGNYIPEFNALTEVGERGLALKRLHATNNFPEFTGRLCPAPCEESCVLNIEEQPVAIKQVEKHLIDWGFETGAVLPQPPARELRSRVAVVGSGPAGLAAAQQLRRAGHQVTVFERAAKAGGLLRYGIPDFKLERAVLDRRIAQLEAEGVQLMCGVEVGSDLPSSRLLSDFDAVLLAVGAEQPRDLDLPGRDLTGIVQAMDYLTAANRTVAGEAGALPERFNAHGKDVMIIGAGDTASDCLGTANRQGAKRIRQLYYKPAPPKTRTADMPWPWWPATLRESSSHEEGGEWRFAVQPRAFEGAGGHVKALHCAEVAWGEDDVGQPRLETLAGPGQRIEADLVLLAIGFSGITQASWLADLGVAAGARGRLTVDDDYRTSARHVFACGDATRGASLIVWAIWEGREAAHRIDRALRGAVHLPTLPLHTPFIA